LLRQNISQTDRDREEKVGREAADTSLKGRGTFGFRIKFTATRLPRQCLFVLLVKIG
jgi:hypothetical protein